MSTSGIEDEDFIINEINANADRRKVAEYILEKYSQYIDFEEAKEIAEKILQSGKIKKESIFRGDADELIKNFVMAYAIRNGSVVDVEYEEVRDEPVQTEVPLKTRKKWVNKYTITALLLLLLAAAAVWGYSEFKEYQRDTKISQSLGMLASDVGSFEHESKASIVMQNRYTIGYNENNEAIVAYHNDKIASDIAEVCRKNPQLFDIVLNNVYFEMENRLANMDAVLGHLQTITADDEGLTAINDKIKRYDVFLDYIFSRGFIDPNDPNYYTVMEDITAYKALRDKGVEVPFAALPVESQQRLEVLISEFELNQDVLYEKYGDAAVDLAFGNFDLPTEPEGMGGRG